MMFCQVGWCPRKAKHGNYCRRHFEEHVGPILPAIPRNIAVGELMQEQNHADGSEA